MKQAVQPKQSANYLCEDMPEAESKTQEELSLLTQPMRTTTGNQPAGQAGKFF